MSTAATFIKGLDPQRRAYILGTAGACAAIGSVFAEDATAYFLVVVPALASLFIWLRVGAPGIPVLPAISGLFVIYYALPMLRSDIRAYGSQELIAAGTAVGGFLAAASVGCLPMLAWARRKPRQSVRSFASDDQIVMVIFVGLAGGIIYNLLLTSGNLAWLGASASVLRSVVSTLSSVACYLLGSARGTGVLVGRRWMLALATLSCLVIVSLGNLFLVGGFTNLVAAAFGYIISAKRIPWAGLVLVFAVASVLQAGKYEMRRMYWLPHSQSLQQTSLFEIPGMMVEWFTTGIAAIGSDSDTPDVLERASLLHMVLLVQRLTPGYIPYLDGGTYLLLPSMLVPRFIEPEKIDSQAGLSLLSVRYGLQHGDATEATTIGWGMVAEAYANFGFTGVVTVGFLFGAFCGFLMRLSTGAAPLSLPMFVTIAATLGLLNVEMDFSYLAVTLAQTMATVFLLALLPYVLPGRRRRASAQEPAAFAVSEPAPRDAHGG
jgi:hypothetical protein